MASVGVSGLILAGLAAMVAAPAVVKAQETTPPLVAAGPVLVLDQDRLFGESRFGKAVLARHQAAVQGLQQENRRIEADLEAEERDLTERRAKLPALEFQQLASDFDAKAEAIRKAQASKSSDIQRRLDQERQQFVDTVRPVLQSLLQDSGASVIIDGRAVFFAVPGLDITDAAIARMDQVLGDGPMPPADGDAAPSDAPAQSGTATP